MPAGNSSTNLSPRALRTVTMTATAVNSLAHVVVSPTVGKMRSDLRNTYLKGDASSNNRTQNGAADQRGTGHGTSRALRPFRSRLSNMQGRPPDPSLIWRPGHLRFVRSAPGTKAGVRGPRVPQPAPLQGALSAGLRSTVRAGAAAAASSPSRGNERPVRTVFSARATLFQLAQYPLKIPSACESSPNRTM